MQERILKTAEFDHAVIQYWVVIGVFISCATLFGIVLAPVIALVIFLVGKRILAAMAAELKERKLVVRRGIFFTEEKSIPLEKITDVAMTQGPLMRMFHLKRLSFETAGQSGQGALVSLIGIKDAQAFREAILQQKDALMAHQANSDEHAPTTDASELTLLRQSVERIERLLAKHIENTTADKV